MASITIFKVAQLIILFIFAIFISDLRKRKGMVPLTNEKLIVAMKVCYLLPICIYGYTVITLDSLFASDFIAFSLTTLGTLLAVKAKRDLREYHTWTGYHLQTTKIMTNGVYAFIRHPLYTAIYIFIFGALSTVIPHARWYFTAIFLITLAYIMVFLGTMATRETNFLARQFGEKFLRYAKYVHPFLPVRKFKN